MVEQICAKIDNCSKIDMVKDKDLTGDWQFAEIVRDVCAKCPDKTDRCPDCNGEGDAACPDCCGRMEDKPFCNTCGGCGREYCDTCKGTGKVKATCEECDGTGQIVMWPCGVCGGTGKI